MSETYLVFGATGWIGGILTRELQRQGKHVVAAKARIEHLQQVRQDLDDVKPTHVLMAAGLTGRPTVDWCEANKEQTLMANVVGLLNVAQACSERQIHCTVFGTGCIYEHSDERPTDKGFTEAEPPNFDGSFYSSTKAKAQDMLMQAYGNNVLLLRIRMPISDDLYARNFIVKIVNYERVIDVPNSVTVLRELLPIALGLAQRKDTGVYNLTNPGTISHNQVLALYRDLVKPDFTWKNMSLAEQALVLAAGRSNCHLDTAKIEAAARELGLPLSPAQEAVAQTMKNIRMQLPLDWCSEI